jgi:predicted ABC-type ATPase
MITLKTALAAARSEQLSARQPMAVIMAGHNGSGKSTMWHTHVSPQFKIPLINADRMMLSVLPEPDSNSQLPRWATKLRDTDQNWMKVAQQGVQSFVAHALTRHASFGMETVFSHWRDLGDGKFESKIDLIEQLQSAGYFVLLIFVGLSNPPLSIARVATRAAHGGHTVSTSRLLSRFRRTQNAIRLAASVADTTIMVDNSREPQQAFTLCRVQIKSDEIYDRRNQRSAVAASILEWMDRVTPRNIEHHALASPS